MFPSKEMVEYMSEINRLFSRSDEDELRTPFIFNPYQSPNQSAMVNRSSSSTDSTSPESYPDLSFRSDFRARDSPRSDTTFNIPRHRAIVGRKILGNTQQPALTPAERIDKEYNIWQQEEPLSETPPESSLQPMTQLYELFTPERSFEFRSPVKEVKMPFPEFSPSRSPTSSTRSSERNLFNLSPTPQYPPIRSSTKPFPMSLLSPTWTNSSLSSTVTPQRPFSSNYVNRFGSRSSFGASSSTDEIAPTKMCTFCRKNGETPVVFMTHTIKEKVGNKNVVTCPILRSHVCTTCGASGDDAHTITYCPVLRSNNNGKPLQSTTITLKNTRIKSNGRRRY